MRNVLEWLEASASRFPTKEAVADPEQSLSFNELQLLAQQAGSYLAGRMTPRHAVGFYLEKSVRALAGMLGAIYAGGYYSVIDVRQPASRAQLIVDTLKPALIVVDEQHIELARETFAEQAGAICSVDELFGGAIDTEQLGSIRKQALDIDPVYVHFTSGSTGAPKGVLTAHRSTIDFVSAFDETFAYSSEDVLGNQMPFDFDGSVKDIFSCLRTGATLKIIPRDYFSVPTKLMDYLCDNEVTSLSWAVSALCFVSIMNGFSYRVPSKIRRVLFTGEVMPPKQLRIWQEALPQASFANLYGPTEITCNCSYFKIERSYTDDEIIPMGKAFPNERVFLLDEDNCEVLETGIEGEVCVAGTTLALGYLGEPEQTAAAFVPNPLCKAWGETIYRTGDLARYDEDGNLVYVSRKDHQIKLLGNRIELGEIDAAAHALAGIERACCTFDSARKRLVLYYQGTLDKKELSAQLKVKLPQYMVPGKIVQMDSLPLSRTGKIDRAALAALN